jgi:hypothetical protein
VCFSLPLGKGPAWLCVCVCCHRSGFWPVCVGNLLLARLCLCRALFVCIVLCAMLLRLSHACVCCSQHGVPAPELSCVTLIAYRAACCSAGYNHPSCSVSVPGFEELCSCRDALGRDTAHIPLRRPVWGGTAPHTGACPHSHLCLSTCITILPTPRQQMQLAAAAVGANARVIPAR